MNGRFLKESDELCFVEEQKYVWKGGMEQEKQDMFVWSHPLERDSTRG